MEYTTYAVNMMEVLSTIGSIIGGIILIAVIASYLGKL